MDDWESHLPVVLFLIKAGCGRMASLCFLCSHRLIAGCLIANQGEPVRFRLAAPFSYGGHVSCADESPKLVLPGAAPGLRGFPCGGLAQ